LAEPQRGNDMSVLQMTDMSTGRMLSIIRDGLRKTRQPKKVIVVGAGMAGLVAASLLKQAGHQVKIIEASSRVGGRVYTLRSPFTQGEYLEAGAMRIPNVHQLTLAYIKKFGLPINSFINATPNDLIYTNGVRTTAKEADRNPNILRFPVAAKERGKSADELFLAASRKILDFVKRNPKRNWPIVVRRFDHYSLDTFLRHNPVGPKLSHQAIDMIQIMQDTEGISQLSYIQTLQAFQLLYQPNIRFYEITGGNDKLPKAFLPQLQRDILFNHKMTKISQRNGTVTIHSMHTKTRQPAKTMGDVAIITVPYSLLQLVEVEPKHLFSYGKRKAIRELHYAPATKIGIQFKCRFWEQEGHLGGKIVTDLPVRYAFYPSHGLGKRGPGTVLASYTWEDDALPWDALKQEDRVRQALEDWAKLHGKKVFRAFDTGTSWSWSQYQYSGGAFVLYRPGQQNELGPHLAKPEGRIFFAGEHVSSTPTWIQGAIESAIRTAVEVHQFKG
jgi:monoamine oxidase